MGKKKTFGKVNRWTLVGFLHNCGYEHRVVEIDDDVLVASIDVDGKKRMIRFVVPGDAFQVCDGAFDRWANSVGASRRMPKDSGEARRFLASMLEERP